MSVALIFKVDSRGAKLNFLVALNIATFFLIRRSLLVPNCLTNRALVSDSCRGQNRIRVSNVPERCSKPYSLRA